MANYGMTEDGGKRNDSYVNMDAANNSSFVYQFCKKYDVNLTKELEDRIDRLLSKYGKDRKFDNDKLINEIENTIKEYSEEKNSEIEEDDYTSTSSHYNNVSSSGGYSRHSGNANDGIYDLNPDDMSLIVNISSSITSNLKGAKITVPPRAVKYANGVIAAARLIRNISLSLSDFKSVIVDSINGAEGNDILYGDSSWEEIGKLLNRQKYSRSDNSEMKEATKDFFLKFDCDVSDDGIVSITNNDGEVYKYNLLTKTLSTDKGEIPCRIYVPDNDKDYSHLNTYTYFTASGSENYDKYIDDSTINKGSKDKSTLKGNAIIIQIDKNNPTVSYAKGKNRFIYDDAYKMVPETTKFINLIAKTDLADNHCRNIIGGDSKFGAYSLGIAADNGDLYKTVYCVNNAFCVNKDIPENAIVTDDDTVLKGNVKGTNKTQLTTDQLKRLSGKDIYMIYANGDENQSRNGAWAKCPPKDSLAISGLDYICNAASSDTNINVIYCNNSSNGHADLRSAYAEKANKYKNLNYDEANWHSFARNEYSTHAEGNWLITELLEADTTNSNYYFYK